MHTQISDIYPPLNPDAICWLPAHRIGFRHPGFTANSLGIVTKMHRSGAFCFKPFLNLNGPAPGFSPNLR
ncbi:protein of unknown function [Burkholderia multivorans]